MSITDPHISYGDFIRNEIKTLGAVQGNGIINSHFSSLYNTAYQLFYQYNGKMSRIDSVPFIFSCEIDLLIEKKEKKVIIEAQVFPDFTLATYALSICHENDNSNELLRKFHFDYAPKVDDLNKKPIYHLQYGGEITTGLGNLGIDVTPIHPWLSSPRLHSIPINLALVLDLVFCEFQSDITNKLVEQTLWRDLIKENEDLMLKEYYNRIQRFLNADHKSTFLLRDFYYGA